MHIFIKKNIFYWLIFLPLLFLQIRCAHQVAPTGGSKDISPPSPKISTPQNRSTNFKGSKIAIQFDEYMQLDNPNGNIIISPQMQNQPTYKLIGKNLYIVFNEKLKDSTTYTIQFGSALKDYREGNILKNYEFAFSTDNKIDSARIEGQVFLAQKQLPADNAVVALYSANTFNTDTTFQKIAPMYLTRTQKDGSFAISNIKKGAYKLVALNDKNTNYMYDLPTEDIAFADSTIHIEQNATLKNLQMNLFNEGNAPPQITQKQHKWYGFIQVLFSKPQDSLQVLPVNKNLTKDQLSIVKSKKNDSLFIYYNNLQVNDLKFIINAPANTQNPTDSLVFKTIPNIKTKNNFRYIGTNIKGRPFKYLDLGIPAEFIFSTPIVKINPEKISIKANKKEISPTQNAQIMIYPNNWQKVWVNYNFKPDTTYTIAFADSALLDFWGQYNSEIVENFTTFPENEYQMLDVKIKNFNPKYQYILDIFNKNDQKVGTHIITKPNQTLTRIKVGYYYATLTHDANKNGKWDTGNFKAQTLPEKVQKTSDFEVKSGWDNEIQIELK